MTKHSQPPSPPTPQEVARYLLSVDAASQSFLGFIRALYPTFKLAPFQLTLIDTLDKLEKGTLTTATGLPCHRLLINMPPRHGKTFIATELFPVYFMARKPYRETMSVSYNSELAKGFGRSVREHCKEPIIAQAFPAFQMASDSTAADVWRTTANGVYYAVGIGGTTSGRAANLLIIDDPIKSRIEAESPTYRNNIYAYYSSALLTRKQPDRDGEPPIEIVIHTRWHPDDLAGRIMNSEEWKNGEWLHINFQAISEVETDERIPVHTLDPSHPSYVPESEALTLPLPSRYIYATTQVALWPERFPLSELKKFERRDPREFASLYQQSPFISGGNLIRTTLFNRYETPPDNISTLIISADTAFKKNERSDYSVLLVAAVTTAGDIYILDLIRKKYDFPELKRIAAVTAARWRGHGLRGLYIEDKASGQSLIQELRKDSGINVIPYRSQADKVARANSILPLIEGGRVFIPKEAHWLEDFLLELSQFPASAHDDQVDALAIALDTLSRLSVTSSSDLINAPLDISNSLFSQAIDQMPSLSALANKDPGSPSTNFKHRTFIGWGE